MSNFFESENVSREMTEIYELQKELYDVIQKFPYMSQDAKWEHIETLKELLEQQQIMWTRMSLSDDPEAIEMKEKLVEASKEMGFGNADMGTIFRNMHNVLEKMQTQLKK